MRGTKRLASPAFFFHQMKRALYICLIFLFSVAPEKGPTAPSSLPLPPLASLPAISVFTPLSVFLSLVSTDTLVSLGVEEQRDSAMGLLEEMGRRREEERGGGERESVSGEEDEGGRGGGQSGRGKKNLSIQMCEESL